MLPLFIKTMNKQRTEQEYYNESKRLREETMRMADELKDNPLCFVVTNVITMDVEITKSDLKTIVSKNTSLRTCAIFAQVTLSVQTMHI